MKTHRYQHDYYTNKATLIIRHIHKLYTMKEHHGKPVIYEDAFLAVHHDFIMAVGVGEGSRYSDKDTQIIDAYGCIVVPGFIDARYHFIHQDEVLKMSDHELLMRSRISLCAMEAGGVTSIHLPAYTHPKSQVRMKQVYEGLKQLREVNLVCDQAGSGYEVVDVFDSLANQDKYCISAGLKGDVNNLFLSAKIMYRQANINAYALLQAMSVHPAKYLKMNKLYGTLAADMQADFVIMQANDIETAFACIAPSRISHVYQAGNCIWQGRLRQ